MLGRLAPEFLLAGDLELGVEAAQAALDELAGTLGLSRDRVAQGIVDVANSNMAQALRLVSTDRGYDPRGATLVAYGGAGPLHACELARALQMPQGAGAALPRRLLGLRRAARRHALRLHADALDAHVAARRGGRGARSSARSRSGPRPTSAREGFAEVPQLVRSIDMRYVGQNWELNVPMPGRRADRRATSPRRPRCSRSEHERFYGYSIPGEELEMLTFNVAAVGTRHADRAAAHRARRAAPEPIAAPARDVRRGGRPGRDARLPARRLRRRRRDRRPGGDRPGRRDDAAAARQLGARSTTTATS